ncbi:S41 family peptidase [Paraglaciecola sp. MB-3u-78]|uniref:S41 family peptidase n=1 Tax=Paraglaciecola sp. MB-3u-78 TaxID=2058332 RepID=UPI000C346FE7|nr:S41 family peptidase [Paraglaciecola sp. MB-3u-78]PKH00143.1 protease [Paraglaciecola sp. MB-3u-78]
MIKFVPWLLVVASMFILPRSIAQQTRLLRQPSISDSHLAFVYAGDIWITDLLGQNSKRLTSTAAIESNPHFSPDGQRLAFSSNRSGTNSVYVMPSSGGQANRLSWHAASGSVRGWTPDGQRVLFASGRDTAPRPINRLWTISVDGGPAELVLHQWAYNGAYSGDGKHMVIDRMSRWDGEWRNYRGGQNTPLVVVDLASLEETMINSDSTIDIEPVWVDDTVYFLSDRDWVSNIWSYSVKRKKLKQITEFKNADIKQLATNGKQLVFEQNGDLFTFDLASEELQKLSIAVTGDFPWAETQWQDVGEKADSASLSPTGKRAIMASRGEIFTVPIEHGSVRNLTQTSDAADRAPIWSPKGDQIAWFSDKGEQGYQLLLKSQDGLSELQAIAIGESKMAWEPTWSPDGKYIAFVDDDVRIRLLELATKNIITVDTGGNNLERGRNDLAWAPDSNALAYVKTADNGFQQIKIYSVNSQDTHFLTNKFANSMSPAWDQNSKYLYFLASTDYGLNSGWANTSSMAADSEYAPYIVSLLADETSPFAPRSDEEGTEEDEPKNDDEKDSEVADETQDKDAKATEKETVEAIKIDFKEIERRILPLPMPAGEYAFTLTAPQGTVFFAKRQCENRDLALLKFDLKSRKAESFMEGIQLASISADHKKLLVKKGPKWFVVDADKSTAKTDKPLETKLMMNLNRQQEWRQIFVEAWRYQRDYFYDKNMHGRDWDEVFGRYESLVKHIKHRADLTYLLDMVNGELSVGHSFVFGGDYPKTPKASAALLGADLIVKEGRWQLDRIFTAESWNPKLKGPLDQPGLKLAQGQYLVGVNGKELTSADNPYKFLDGTVDQQTVLHINDKPSFSEAWQITVKPTGNETALRQRAWVEDNRRLVDKLSDGKLAYVWVPNTSSPGFVSFNRYFFAQQDKLGAVIDERFNGGGLLDDYMVDLMNRKLRAALTNEVPNGKPLLLPAGIKGPKVLLINELAGSGGDYFPWAFRQQKVGKLIGARTWGGLVKSSVHYALVDGGALTAPDNAVFDPVNNKWVGENIGIAPDIEVYQDAQSLAKGDDPQLLTGVKELMKQLKQIETKQVTPPKYSTPAIQN